MCGIAGELRLTSGERASAERVRAMCDVMVHRGPDSHGEYFHGEVGLGMRRLSINDVEFGQQPLGNEDGTVQVVCNGEIYNAPALTKMLLARGHTLKTRSDVEVIAHCYEEYGTDFARHIEGMFSLALWDGKAHRLVLGRDRIGRSLYVAERGAAALLGLGGSVCSRRASSPRSIHRRCTTTCRSATSRDPRRCSRASRRSRPARSWWPSPDGVGRASSASGASPDTCRRRAPGCRAAPMRGATSSCARCATRSRATS
jgi:glutamine phosphoribosylpyrophosphate amidotransferase